MRGVVRVVVVGTTVAVVVGTVDGVLARLLMRGVSFATGAGPEFTLRGSAFIVALFVVTAVPAGITAVATMRPLTRRIAIWVGWLPLGYASAVIGVPELLDAVDTVAGATTPTLGIMLLTLLLAIVTIWNGVVAAGIASFIQARPPSHTGEHASGR